MKKWSEYSKEWREKNPEKHKQFQRNWYKKNHSNCLSKTEADLRRAKRNRELIAFANTNLFSEKELAKLFHISRQRVPQIYRELTGIGFPHHKSLSKK